MVALLYYSIGHSQDWKTAREQKAASIDVYWYVSVPFIYEEPGAGLTGIEYELMSLFREYLKAEYDVALEVNWREAKSFAHIMDTVSQSDQPDIFGASAFSITPIRQAALQFTAPYLPDIAVLVSSQGSPIVETQEEIAQMMSEMVAVTIEGTTYEDFLFDLRNQLDIDFEMTYIQSDFNILDKISEAADRFGYIDLPIYLMLIKRGGDLTRQHVFTIRGTGYGLIMPLGSGWNGPFNEFLINDQYRPKIDSVFSTFLGQSLFDFMEEIKTASQVGTSILAKEKELQLDLIRNTSLMLERQKTYTRFLIIGIGLSMALLVLIFWLFFRNKRTTRELIKRKNQVEAHQDELQKKSEQLMSRNEGLLALNEEKNNFVRILAHDLRSPLSQIIGIADLLTAEHEVSGQKDLELLSKISEGGRRINDMINKILNVDSIEQNDIQVVWEEVKISDMLEDVFQRFSPVAQEKGIGLQLSHDHIDRPVLMDRVLLLQILDNLVSNAIKFSPTDTEVRMKAFCDASGLLIRITDQGPGFSEADKALMFNRFQKLSAQPTGNALSTGLGLSIVKRYVAELRGEISLATEVGKGSTFSLRFQKAP